MLSKMLSFHKGLFIQTMRSASWIGVLYFVCLFFILPLQVMMMYSRGEWTYPYETKSLLAVTPEFQMVLVFTIPVLLAIFLFRFLHIKGAADYIHSLPVHREAIYWQSVWYGLILLVVPVLLNGFIMGILREVLRIHDLYSIESIVSWTVLMICFSTFVFMAAVLMGMLTGISVLQGFFLFVFILFPAGISLLVLTNLALQLHGFAIDYYMSINFGRLVPFVRFLESVNTPITAVEWTIYSILIGLFFIAALFIYKARPTESAGQAIAFRKIRPLFMYGFTLCATLVGGVYFGIIQDSPDWVFFGYLCGSLAGYFFAAVVLEKTWRVFHQWKGYILFLAVFVVLGFAVRLDLLGYEDTLPDLSEIERAYISSSVYGLTSEKLNGEIDSRGVFHEQEPSDYYQTGENIQHIYGYHQAVMKAGEIQPSKHSTPKIFAYELKNGEKFVRQYNIVESQYESYMGPIAESDEYKENQYPLLRKEEDQSALKITIRPVASIDKSVVLNNPSQIKEFTNLLRKEMTEEPAESILGEDKVWSDIQLVYEDRSILTASFKSSYTQLTSWMEEKGLMEEARVMPEDISYAKVIKNDKHLPIYEFNEETGSFQGEQVITIKDKEVLESCLQASLWKEEADYVIAYYYLGQPYPDIQAFSEEEVPEMIKKKFP